VFGKFFVKVQADRYIVGLRAVARIDVPPISATPRDTLMQESRDRFVYFRNVITDRFGVKRQIAAAF